MVQLRRWTLPSGIAVAVAGSPVVTGQWFVWFLAVLGLVAGAAGVGEEGRRRFLLAAMALLVAANAAGSLPWIGGTPSIVIANLVAFLCPAVVIVALKSLFEANSD